MSLEVYNQLMSDMLNQRRALAKLRAELEGREGRICRRCGKFGHLVRNCRSGKEQKTGKMVENRFEVLKSHVMQCGVREVRRQEIVKEEVKCFGCGEKGYKKWKCPRRRKQEETVPPHEVWEKVKEHSRTKGLPPKGAVMCMEGWTTPREVVTFVECRGCDYKGTKTQENQGRGFLSKKQLLHIWCEGCREAKEWREKEAQSGRTKRIVCSACDVRDAVKERVEKNKKGEIFCPPCRTGKKIPWWN